MLGVDRRSDPNIAVGCRIVDWRGYFFWTGQWRSARAAYQPNRVGGLRRIVRSGALVLMVAQFAGPLPRQVVLGRWLTSGQFQCGFEFRHRRLRPRWSQRRWPACWSPASVNLHREPGFIAFPGSVSCSRRRW